MYAYLVFCQGFACPLGHDVPWRIIRTAVACPTHRLHVRLFGILPRLCMPARARRALAHHSHCRGLSHASLARTPIWYFAKALHARSQVPVLYPFGHGLSYASFAYSGLTAALAAGGAAQSYNVSVTVTNTGRERRSCIVRELLCISYIQCGSSCRHACSLCCAGRAPLSSMQAHGVVRSDGDCGGWGGHAHPISSCQFVRASLTLASVPYLS